MSGTSDEKRSRQFARNQNLEELLKEVNGLLAPANKSLLSDTHEQFPKVFVMGALRSGTTLFMQWLAATGLFAYPTNLLSRFYEAPLVGAKIQQLLTDPRYNFRDEILDFNSPVSYSSENGKTKGALSPNEFWYFWRRFLPTGDLDYWPDSDLMTLADTNGLACELNALANIHEKPFALKGMILNQNIPTLDRLFKNALFVWIHRDPVFNVQSVLEARQRQFGDVRQWYSFKIREYPELKNLEPMESAAGQVCSINRDIEKALSAMPAHRTLKVSYEQFCDDPRRVFEQLRDRLAAMPGGASEGTSYRGELRFPNTNCWRLPEYDESRVRQYIKTHYDVSG